MSSSLYPISGKGSQKFPSSRLLGSKSLSLWCRDQPERQTVILGFVMSYNTYVQCITIGVCWDINKNFEHVVIFQYTEIQKSPCIETWRFKNFRVLYTQIFFKRPITRRNCNRWWRYLRVWIRGLGTTDLWKKQSSKISCYCPFKGFPHRASIFLLY